jgi:nitrate reductase gamma subunit
MTREFEQSIAGFYITFSIFMIIIGAIGITQNLYPVIAYGVCLCIGVITAMALITVFILRRCLDSITRNPIDV